MNNQSILNYEITTFFNNIIGNIQNPDAIGLRYGETPLSNIQSLHYNQSTETIYIEMDTKFYTLKLSADGNLLYLDEFVKSKRETQ